MDPIANWKPANEDANWIASAAALQEAIIASGSEVAALESLDAWADTASIRARASTYVVELDFGPLSLTPPTETSSRRLKVARVQDENFIMLGPAFWRAKTSSAVQEDVSRWESGIFALVDDAPPLIKRFKNDEKWYRPVDIRHVVYGVEFLQEDVEKLMHDIRTERRKGRTFPRKKKWAWAPILAKLESEVESGSIARLGAIDDWGVQAEIEREIQFATTDFTGDGPSEASVRRKAQGIMSLWRLKLAQQE